MSHSLYDLLAYIVRRKSDGSGGCFRVFPFRIDYSGAENILRWTPLCSLFEAFPFVIWTRGS